MKYSYLVLPFFFYPSFSFADENSIFERIQLSVSNGIDYYSGCLDRMLVNKLDERCSSSNDSYGRLTFKQTLENGGMTFDPSLKLKVDLPRTKKRYNISLETTPEETQPLGDRVSASSPKKAQRGLSIGINHVAKEFNKWDLDYGFGVKTRLPMKVFSRAKAERSFNLSDKWEGEYRHKIFYFYSGGFSTEGRLNFERDLANNSELDITTHLRWEEENEALEFAEIVGITQVLSERERGVFEMGVLGTGFRESQLKEFYMNYSYKRLLNRDWLIGTLTPELKSAREYDFKVVSSVTFKIEILFD